jgi:hypothetical protein
MARQIFEVNRTTGMTTWFDYDDATDNAFLYHEQDLTPLLEYTRAHAREGAKDHGIKAGFWHYAEIPTVIIYEMRKKGIDVFNHDHMPRVLKEIDEHYPWLKMTEKKHRL